MEMIEEMDYLHRAVQEIVDYGIILLDTDGTIVEWNKGAENIKGYASKEIIGKNFVLFYPADDRLANKPQMLLEKARLEGRAQDEGWRVRKDGTLFWGSITITAIYDDECYLTGYIKVTRDLTERKSAENEMDKLIQKLSRQNMQLLNFAHIASHNLRAPVSNITSLLALYLETESKDERLELFDKFSVVTRHLSETLNELIDNLRVQEDVDKEREIISFSQVYEKTKQMLSAEIRKTFAHITADFSAVSEYKYPRSYMESIFLNLLSNALKFYSPERIPEIHFETKLEDGLISLYVSDNGLGINLERHKDKVFGLHKTFHRLPDSKGVGLYMTKSQVEAMGGTVSLESEVDKGSTFKITFNHIDL